mmetsp:Transcript_5933/g.16670  ORF Transcript_5933/g.16670 Transcript_5933/m.16670 type:complete len:112 (-) Transcript_5933:245-580(-)
MCPSHQRRNRMSAGECSPHLPLLHKHAPPIKLASLIESATKMPCMRPTCRNFIYAQATAMASLILADYMFFEKDQGMCSIDGQTIRITLCDMYCCGCTQPLNVVVPINNRS